MIRVFACALLVAVSGFARAADRLGYREDPRKAAVVPDCEAFIASLPAGYFYGTVTVPEDWQTPSGRKISVFYYGRKEPGVPEKTPVVFFNGGPSSDSHGSFRLFLKERLADKLTFVYIDQRGTGCSSSYPAGKTAADVERLMNYGTRAIVNDAEAVRARVFGLRTKWSLLGHSYGGMIVQRYLAMYPQSVDLAVAAGYSVMSDPVQWLKLRILTQKRMGEEYLIKYPGDKALLEKIKGAIPASKCFSLGGAEICGSAVMDSMVSLLSSRDTWPAINTYLDALAKAASDPGFADSESLKDFVNVWVFLLAGDNVPAELAITRLEMSLDASDGEHCVKVREELAGQGDDPERWPFNECRLLAGVKYPAVEALLSHTKKRDPLRLADIKAGLASRPELRFYLYIGGDDVFDTVESFAEEKEALGSLAHIEVLPGVGHDGLTDNNRVWGHF